MIQEILTYILTIFLPFGVMYACKHSSKLNAIGPIIILYAFGVLASLLGLRSNAQTVLSSLTVPLAIPLILFGNNLKLSRKSAKDPVLAFFSCLGAALLATTLSYIIFRPSSDLAGMTFGCITGGTMNMASIKLALGIDDATFVLMNTYDMAVCFTYMMFLLLFGINLSRKILPRRTKTDDEIVQSGEEAVKPTVKNYLTVVGIAVLCCGVSYAIAQIFPEDVFMLVFIMILTAFGIGLSFVKKVRTTPGSYDAGMYSVYAFSFVVASMADFRGMSISENANLLCFYVGSVFGSLFLHLLFSYILKIDADTAVIASNAFVNAPPTVPVVASAQKNRTALTSGLTIGIVGYALGTYLGIFIAKMLGMM